MDHSKPTRVVVMTGATAGLGAHALQNIAAQPNVRVIIGARGGGRTVRPGIETLPLDLSSLASVREFADTTKRRLGNASIDVLVLNAGMQNSDNERRSANGFELTFAVNHLAHYLLARLLMPRMAAGGRLVITTSETHDPTITPIAPRTLDPWTLAYPITTGLGSGIRAYAASKLCNLLTAQSFAAMRDIRERRISVVAFSPGLTAGTSLGRDNSVVARTLVTILMHTIFRVIGLFRPEYVVGTPERSGEVLALVALGIISPPDGRIYLSLVKGQPTFPEPSELARSQRARDQLWCESAGMVGLEWLWRAR